jgi:signal transduction histidine kinase/ligand-binding sensor domain-containing protein
VTRSRGSAYCRPVEPRRSARWPAAASALCVAWVLTGTAWALDPHRHVTQFGHTAWRTQDGFVNGSVAVTQTVDGYIWVATFDGLVRFDGVTFSPWSPLPGESLPAPGFGALLGARDGSLWIGTTGGLSRLKDGHLFNYTTTPRSPGISAIAEDAAGTIWVTRYRVNDGLGALCRVAGERLACYGKKEGLAPAYGLGLAVQPDGTLWFACRMLCRFGGGAFTSYFEEQMTDPAGGVGVRDVAVDRTGAVWATFSEAGPKLGVRQLVNGEWTPFVVPGFDGRTESAYGLFVDRQDTLWIAADSGLYRVHDRHADRYDRSKGLSGDSIYSMHEDREGNLWVATDRGLDMLRDTSVVTYSTVEGLTGGGLNSVLAVRDGSVWVGTKGALNIVQSDDIRAIDPRHGLPGGEVGGLFEDTAGRIWAGVDNTVMTYERGRFSPIVGADGRPVARGGTGSAFAEDRNGDVWTVTCERASDEHHLLRIRDRRVVEDIPADAILSKPHYLAADQQEGVWIAGDRDAGALVRIRKGKPDVVARLDGPEGPVTGYSLSVDTDGGVLFATSRGLFRWQHGRMSRLDTSSGLPCATVYSAIRDDEEALWLYARCGLLRVRPSEWSAWLEAPDSKVSPGVFDFHDGAQPSTGVLSQPVVGKSPDGRLWFASNSFVQTVDPRRTYVNAVRPPVTIEAIVADGKRYDATAPVRLPPLRRQVVIDYTALSFKSPRRVRFRYQLEGHDPDWQDAGARRQALYNDLRPGRYRFHVIASNDAGVWNEEGAALDFTIEPAWFQTRWFVAGVGIAVLAAATALYRMRVRQLAKTMKARFDERLAERTRVARDLHDTLLQTVQGSKLVADHALKDTSDNGQLVRAMTQLAEWLAQANEEGRAALESLRIATSEVNDLADALRRAVDECRGQTNMDVSLSVVGERRELHAVARDEVYRIGYEALRNACRHSKGRAIEVALEYARDLTLRIRDDGVAIEPAVLEKGKDGHFGLQGMRERAARIGGRLEIETLPSSGTTVTLVVPGLVAFTTGSRSQERPGTRTDG